MEGSELSNGSAASKGSALGSHRKGVSGSNLLSKLSFLRSSPDNQSHRVPDNEPTESLPRVSSSSTRQQKSRPRKGSLRKVALLGRGAQRERRDAKSNKADVYHGSTEESHGPTWATVADRVAARPGLDGSSKVASFPPLDTQGTSSTAFAVEKSDTPSSRVALHVKGKTATSPAASYISTSTTDEEDALHIPAPNQGPLRPNLSLSSGSESYFPNRSTLHRKRSTNQTKSPLSYSGVGLSTAPIPPTDSDWDYSETERWGWALLVVTWLVFVTGMGSCLGMWSWAWDVGTTPSAPPELEDDPTLPIVGYYPALMILTCVLAWVWVVIAWVGMKYFRHAKITGD